MAGWRALSSTMRTARRRRIGQQESERLLSGEPVGFEHQELRHLLASAAAPPRPAELVGKRAAVAAFEQAGRKVGATTTLRRRPRVLTPLLARSFAVKAVSVAAVLLVGSTALAAGTGNLPSGAQQRAYELFAAIGVPPPGSDLRPAATPGGRGGVAPATPDASISGTPDPSGSVALTLCEAWEAAQKDPGGKAMTAEALRGLVAAAGGKPSIAKFCAAVLAEKRDRAASEAATPSTAKTPATPTPSHPGAGNGHGNGNGRGRPSPTPHH